MIREGLTNTLELTSQLVLEQIEINYQRDSLVALNFLAYLKTSWNDKLEQGKTADAVLRVRPKAMTVAVILAGLLPIMWGTGTGSEAMHRIAAPMVGGMITAPLLSMFVIPAVYLLMRRARERRARRSFWVRRTRAV